MPKRHGCGHVDGWGGFLARLHAAIGLAVLAYLRRDCGRSEASYGDCPKDFLEYEANEMLPAVLSSFGLRSPILSEFRVPAKYPRYRRDKGRQE